MKKKYYAYLGKRGEWTVKRYHGHEWFLWLVKEALKPTTLLAAYLLPWEMDVTRKEWYTSPESDPSHPAWTEFFRIIPHASTRHNRNER